MQATIKTIPVPPKLQQIADPPQRLYCRGSLPDGMIIGIVGSRRATPYGLRVASELAARLAAAGVAIVSGLAFGIDITAHRAALETGGQTIAIMPGGLADRSITPRSHLAWAMRIARQGALLSEYPPETAARKEHYAARNRLISGLADTVVVIEAAQPSGSLITARHAAEQGTDVWAVPGTIDNPLSAGTNKLIADGAQPLLSIEYFLESIGFAPEQKPADGILSAFSSQPIHINELAERAGLGGGAIEAEVVKMEIRGLVREVGGGFYVRS